MSDLILFIFGTALVNNIVVGHLLGADPALAFNKRLEVARGLCLVLLILLPLITLLTYVVQHYVLNPLELDYLQLPFLLTLIVLLAWSLKAILPQIHQSWSDKLPVFLPLAGINTTVLGTVLLNLQQTNSILQSLFFGLGTAAGFALVLLLLTPVREKLECADIPVAFRGTPIILMTLSLLAMSFLGFTGLLNAS